MRKSIYYIIAITLLCSTGCQKDTLQTYDADSEGSSIYFMEPMTQKKDITREISFGYSGFSVRDSIISIPWGFQDCRPRLTGSLKWSLLQNPPWN